MKSGKRILIAFTCIITVINIFSCGESHVYTGQHRLDGEQRRDDPADNKQAVVKNENKTSHYDGTKELIAVMDFTAKGVSGSIAASVSELIRMEMINSGRYTVLERSQMKEILKEQGFQQTGCTEVACAVKIGKLLSAKKMLVGTVMKLGSKLIISGRIIDVERGIGEKAAKGKADSADQLDEGVSEFVNNL
jgi:curli biogenesis system outer membrane secretion channel CsgG